MKELAELIEFKRWYDNLINEYTTDDELDQLYESEIEITIAGRTIKLNFDAENYNNLEHLLKRAIEEF